VGLKIGEQAGDLRHVVLEVHYDKAYRSEGAVDHAGIRFWATKENVVRQRMGMMVVADPFARFPHTLPPQQTSVEVDMHCPPGCTATFRQPMHVFASMTHAHLRATSVHTFLGTPSSKGHGVPVGAWRHVVASGHFAHDHQLFAPADFTLGLGDALRTTCKYDTTNDTEPVAFGPYTSNEMCMQVFLYWPKQYPYLCGYYSAEKFYCGGATGFHYKTDADGVFFNETMKLSN